MPKTLITITGDSTFLLLMFLKNNSIFHIRDLILLFTKQ